MATQLLYSVNPFLKLVIQEQFRNDLHYVWCSEQTDASMRSPYSFASLIPPSSNPKDIYQDLRDATLRSDKHNPQIVRTKAMYTKLAADWVSDGSMTPDSRDELVVLLDTADMKYWRPLLYVIPRVPVAAKLHLVPPGRRAGHGVEYIIEDLARDEFDIVEL